MYLFKKTIRISEKTKTISKDYFNTICDVMSREIFLHLLP